MSAIGVNNPVSGSTAAQGGFTRRTRIVWAAFIAAMTMVGGFLVVTDPNPAPKVASGRSLFHIPTATDSYRTIFDTSVPIKADQWTDIIIEHSGQPHGTIETISRNAQTDGVPGLPHHFVIGNGDGMGDGDLHLGYRWNMQTPGAPLLDDDTSESRRLNNHAIRICLIGNGENRAFSLRQMERLAALVAGLERELQIPASHVHFGEEFRKAAGPGSNFDTRLFQRLLAELKSDG